MLWGSNPVPLAYTYVGLSYFRYEFLLKTGILSMIPGLCFCGHGCTSGIYLYPIGHSVVRAVPQGYTFEIRLSVVVLFHLRDGGG